ncbi:MAG: queuosine precursor transporter [Bacteroidaceae bacterium]|nr:queuosine precursor transporter [Bacteroidaceae bacterium]
MTEKNKQQVSVLFMMCCLVSTVCLIAANVFETKQISFFGHSQTGGVIVFPISYIMNDVVCEVWGFKKSRLLIWISFLLNFCFVGIGAICDALPGADYWDNDAGFHAIFGLVPRIAAASFIAFFCGSFVNAYVMSRMKVAHGNRLFALRAIGSTIVGEAADSAIFFPLALGGVIPWDELPWLMLYQVILKTTYEVVALPLTTHIVRRVKDYEGTDVTDTDEAYNIWRVFDL